MVHFLRSSQKQVCMWVSKQRNQNEIAARKYLTLAKACEVATAMVAAEKDT